METIADSAIIIYQMGKVGSTSIHRSLEHADLTLPIYKVHFLSDEGLQHGEEFHQKTLKIPWEETPHIQTSQFLREQIQNNPAIQWKVITLVREPISREVSEFFQYVHSMYPELLDADGNLDERKAIRILQTKLMFYNPEQNYTCCWFDMEMKGMFGIDVFAHPFNTEEGFSIIKQGNVELLTLRLESLDQNFSQAMTQFLGVDTPIEMVRSNVRAEQKRGTTYQHVAKSLMVRESVCEKIYASRYAQHFYSPSEIEQFTQKWTFTS